jgi:hypothetical protein
MHTIRCKLTLSIAPVHLVGALTMSSQHLHDLVRSGRGGVAGLATALTDTQAH